MKKGFTVIELLIVIAIIGILAAVVSGAILDNRGATEKRAKQAAVKFLEENGISYQRMSCAGDSDHDGYGTCNIMTDKGEKIMLNCQTGFFDTKVFGASECKEVYANINFGMQN